MLPAKVARKSYVTFGDTENSIQVSRLSGSRYLSKRTRTSIVPHYSLNLNTDESSIQNDLVNEVAQNDALCFYVLNHFWNIYRVSPLNNLQYTETKLKHYASKLKQYLVCNIKNNTTVIYNVEIKIVKDLKLELKHDDALQVKVLTGNGDNLKCVYEGILFSWCHHDVCENSNITHLPLLFDRGNKNVSKCFKQWLMKFFDCVVNPMSFAQHELLFFIAILSSFHNDTDRKPINFIYDVPITKTTTTLNLSLKAADFNKIWLRCFPEGEQPRVLSEQCSSRLYTKYQQFINHVYEIDVARLDLVILKYANAIIHNTGKIQLKDISMTRVALKILCEMSIILKGPTPKLAAEYD